jgi:hypothetical protein
MLIALSSLSFLLAAAPATRPDPFCAALRKVAGGADVGFVAVKGPAVDPRAAAPELFRVRLALPNATDCTVTAPRRGPATYACVFSGGIDVKRAMGRLVRRSARCVDVRVGNPPRLKDRPGGPYFYFASGVARFDFSSAPAPGKPGVWTLTLAITKGPDQPRRPVI